VARLLTLGTICTSGIMMGMDRYFGKEWVEQLHGTSVDLLMALVVFHLGGVVLASLRHRENLVGSMIHGQKVSHDHDDNDPRR